LRLAQLGARVRGAALCLIWGLSIIGPLTVCGHLSHATETAAASTAGADGGPAQRLVSAPVVDEIRGILAARLLPAPDPADLARLVGPMSAQALGGALRALDPFASLLPAPAPDPDRVLSDRRRESRPRLGVDLVDWEGWPVLVPDADGPAWRAGLTEPVILRAINGHDVTAVSAEAVARFARARAGALDPVELVVTRSPAADAERLRVVVRPGRVALDSFGAFTLKDHPIMRIRRFETRQTRSRLALWLDRAPSSAPILDLRACRGGDLFEALDSAALFLPEGSPLAYTQARGDREQLYRAPRGGRDSRRSPVIWVGPGTASACEILAGVLHRAGRAHVIGRPTRGKCESQTEVALSTGQRLRFTNRLVRFMDGTTCSGVGLLLDRQLSLAALMDSTALLSASRVVSSQP